MAENAFVKQAREMVERGVWSEETAAEYVAFNAGDIGFVPGETGYQNLPAWEAQGKEFYRTEVLGYEPEPAAPAPQPPAVLQGGTNGGTNGKAISLATGAASNGGVIMTNGQTNGVTNGQATPAWHTGDSPPVALETAGPLAAIGGVAGLFGIGSMVWDLIQQFQIAGQSGGGGGGGAVAPYQGGGQADIIPYQYGIGGPGIPEPKAGTFYKTWRIETEDRTGKKVYTYFWRMYDGYTLYYSTSGKMGRFKPKKPVAVVMQGGKMSMQAYVKLDKYLDRMTRRIAKRSKRLKLQ